MAKDLRRFWPSRTVNVAGLARAHGFASIIPGGAPPGTGGPPKCPHCPGTALTYRGAANPCAVGYVTCPRCGAADDPVAFAARAAGRAPREFAAALHGAGLLGSARSVRADVLAGYAAHARGRDAFAALDRRMAARRVDRITGSDAHETFKISDRAHHHPLWWCSTVGELDDLVTRASAPGGSAGRLLGAPDYVPVLLVPVRDWGRLVGVWALAGHVPSSLPGVYELNWVYLKVPGETGGFGPAVVGPGTDPEFTFDPTDAVLDLTAHVRNGARARLQLVTGVPPPGAFAGHRAVVVRAATGGDFWPVAVGAGAVVRDQVSGPLVRWERFLFGLVRTDPHRVPDDWVPLWTPARRARALAAGTLTQVEALVIDRAAAERRCPGAGSGRLEVRRGLTVEVVPDGFLWAERGLLLLAARVVVTRVYRGDDRRVRYRGYVGYGGTDYPFDSAAFRAHPDRVVEAAVLRGGGDPPPVHPALVPHLARIVLYLRALGA